MARKKIEAGSLKDLYTESIMELMYLRRAFRALKEVHPDFRNLSLPEDRTEESFAEFVGRVRHIAEEAQRKGGEVVNVTDDIMPMYIGLDIPLLFNPITMGTADLFNDEEE